MNDRTAHPTPTIPALRPPLPPSPLASRLAYWGYDAVGGLAALLALPAWPWLRKRGFDDGIEERLRRLPAAAGALAAPPIWLHCASVGEALSATPLVARLRERCPQRRSSSRPPRRPGAPWRATKLRADVATSVAAVDALRVVDRVFRRVRPRALLVVESGEIWPGLFRAAARVARADRHRQRAACRPAPWSAVAGPARCCRRRWHRWRCFGMQTRRRRGRIVALSAPVGRVHVTRLAERRACRPRPSRRRSPASIRAGWWSPPARSRARRSSVLQAFAPLRRSIATRCCCWRRAGRKRFLDEAAAMLDAARLRWVRRSTAGDGVAPDVDVVLLDHPGRADALLQQRLGGVRRRQRRRRLGGHNVPRSRPRTAAPSPSGRTRTTSPPPPPRCARLAARRWCARPASWRRTGTGCWRGARRPRPPSERARAVALARAESLGADVGAAGAAVGDRVSLEAHLREAVWPRRSLARRASSRWRCDRLSAAFGVGVALRGAGLSASACCARARHAGAEVVSIGNLAVGGTGKTPVTLWVAEGLRARGAAPAIVSRGYGGSSARARRWCRATTASRSGREVGGDEPVMLAKTSPACRDRLARRLDGARAAAALG